MDLKRVVPGELCPVDVSNVETIFVMCANALRVYKHQGKPINQNGFFLPTSLHFRLYPDKPILAVSNDVAFAVPTAAATTFTSFHPY